MANDPTDPTIQSFTAGCNAETSRLKKRRQGIEAIVAALLVGDNATADALALQLRPFVNSEGGAFYTNLAAGIVAVKAEIAAAIAAGTDATLIASGPLATKLAHDKDTELLAINNRRVSIIAVRDLTLGGDVNGANAALATLQTQSRLDGGTFYANLPAAQASTAAVIAEPAAPVTTTPS